MFFFQKKLLFIKKYVSLRHILGIKNGNADVAQLARAADL